MPIYHIILYLFIFLITFILNIQSCNGKDIINNTLKIYAIPDIYVYTCTYMFIEYLHDESFYLNPNDRILTKLTKLNLNFNNISILHDDQFKQLLELEYISMSNNKIKFIGSSIFSKNINIEYINLYVNNIVKFDFKLDVLKLLWFLNLSYNKLSTLKENVFIDYLVNKNTDRVILRIANNNFKCDCSRAWIRKIDYSNIKIESNKTDLCSANMTKNVTVWCFMRKEMSMKCGQINIEKCIKGKLFNYIYKNI